MSKTARWLSALMLLVSAFCQAAPTVLRTAAQEGSAPKFIDAGDEKGGASGHCPDILHAIEKLDPQLQFDIDPTPTPIKRLESDVKDGRLDIVCALLETPARNENAYRIPTPLFYLRERLVGRVTDTLKVTSMADLAKTGDLVVTQSGASYAAVLRSNGVEVLETSGGSATALRNVVNKRARFYYTNELTGAYYIRSEGLQDSLRLHPGVLQTTPSFLWVGRHVDGATMQRLERVVARLQKNGELERIYRSYQGGKL